MIHKTGKALVIVESPTKARTIEGYLPDGFVVEASVGHVRDLPSSAREIPAAVKGQPWARLGIDVEHDFKPIYVVPADKKKQVQKLKERLRDAEIVYLATDEDREGESISWHLVDLLKPKVPQKRLVFHEITREAIREALEHPRELDERLVQAQETRRILDRLYGYEVSPILWRKVKSGLSAGRVQSVAVRLCVERERERRRFRRSTYWDLAGRFEGPRGPSFEAVLTSLGGRRIARGKDFDPETGQLRKSESTEVVLVDEERARDLEQRLRDSSWRVEDVDRKPYIDRPAPPFTTSTLQQEANRKLRLSARATMQAAQRLYERGFITYMRTDSITLSEQAIQRSRELIRDLYGSEFLPDKPRRYRTKVKNAQEAHEAIRPSADFHRPDVIRRELGGNDAKVYELIWKRTMACQMADARGHRMTLRVGDGEAVFQAGGKTIEFPGYLRAYVEGADDPDAELADKEVVLPVLEEGQEVRLIDLEAKSHTTQPPPRYTDASLVKELEAKGIGRPSTYASIIDTILRREYVVKQGTAFVPTFTAFAVVQLMERHFAHLVDVRFTARMEDDLDAISLGRLEPVPYLRAFYFGDGAEAGMGLKQLVESEIDAREACTIPIGEDPQGRRISVRVGKYGPYLERIDPSAGEDGVERAPIPESLPPDELDVSKAIELFEQGSGPTELGVDPETGKKVYVRTGRFGPYVQLGEDDERPKPRRKSLLPGMEMSEVRLEDALRLLHLPRKVGVHPESGEEVLADLGRYGPYVKCGTESRSLDNPEQIFDITLEAALARLAEPSRGRRRRASQVLRGLGTDPVADHEVQLLEGPYGLYVSNGSTNASVPKGTEADAVTLESALEWIREKEATGKSSKRKKASRKKSAKKKAAKKKSAKKSAKKQSAKKKASKQMATDQRTGGARQVTRKRASS